VSVCPSVPTLSRFTYGNLVRLFQWKFNCACATLLSLTLTSVTWCSHWRHASVTELDSAEKFFKFVKSTNTWYMLRVQRSNIEPRDAEQRTTCCTTINRQNMWAKNSSTSWKHLLIVYYLFLVYHSGLCLILSLVLSTFKALKGFRESEVSSLPNTWEHQQRNGWYLSLPGLIPRQVEFWKVLEERTNSRSLTEVGEVENENK